ncbi:MAG: hypothetical protein AAFP92_23615 [Bacteroidota bacterium]
MSIAAEAAIVGLVAMVMAITVLIDINLVEAKLYSFTRAPTRNGGGFCFGQQASLLH